MEAVSLPPEGNLNANIYGIDNSYRRNSDLGESASNTEYKET